MKQFILGDYDFSNIKLVIISNESFVQTRMEIIKNTDKIFEETIDIIKYKVNSFVIKNIFLNFKYNINFYHNNILIEKIKLNLEKNPFDNVKIVNCDSSYGLNTKTWDIIKGNSNYIIHAGDQIYNDVIFNKYYYKHLYSKKLLSKKEKKIIYKELYDYYIKNFSFDKKAELYKSNFHIMIPDNHEIVAFATVKTHDSTFNIVSPIFIKLAKEIQINLKFNQKEICYLKDNQNSTIYVLNYNQFIIEKEFLEYKFEDNIQKYDNIVIISRKSILKNINNPLEQIIYGVSYDYNIDFLIKILVKYDKTCYILCGDEHVKQNSKLFYNDKEIINIKLIGAVNTCVDILDKTTTITSNIDDIKFIGEDIIFENGFININYSNNKIVCDQVINKKTFIFHLINSVISSKNFSIVIIYYIIIYRLMSLINLI